MTLAVLTVLGMIWVVIAFGLAAERAGETERPLIYFVPSLAFALLWPAFIFIAVMLRLSIWATPKR